MKTVVRCLLLLLVAGYLGIIGPLRFLAEQAPANVQVTWPPPLPDDPPPVAEGAAIAAKVGGATAPDGTPVQLDLPKELHLKNCGGSDGAGLCVFTSLNHSAFWQNIPALMTFRDWMRKFPGGGWPGKVDQYVQRRCKELNLSVEEAAPHIHVESKDLEVLKLAVKTGRMPGVTYSFSPTGRYGGSRISHMVTLVHAGAGKGPDGKGWWAILDNNYPGSLEWMSEAEFLRTYAAGGQGWACIFLNPGPPPIPIN